MAFRVKPDFSAVWASLGDNTKPVDSYITNGWESVKPPRQYFNWIDNRQDSAIAYLYQSGIPEWDALTDYEGGAGVNSYTQGSDGKVYRCLADNGPNVVSIGAKDPTNPLNSAFWTVAFVEKSAVDSLASTVATHTTQIGNGSGVTDPAAWRTALSVPSTSEAVVEASFTGANQSLGTDGFQKLPGGLIIQWGKVTRTLGAFSGPVNFPIPFPNSCFSVTNGNSMYSGPNSLVTRTRAISATQFAIEEDSYGANGHGNTASMDWIAIGY